MNPSRAIRTVILLSSLGPPLTALAASDAVIIQSGKWRGTTQYELTMYPYGSATMPTEAYTRCFGGCEMEAIAERDGVKLTHESKGYCDDISLSVEGCYRNLNIRTMMIDVSMDRNPTHVLVRLTDLAGGRGIQHRWQIKDPEPEPLRCTANGKSISLPGIAPGEQSSKFTSSDSLSVKCNRRGTVAIVVRTSTIDFGDGITSKVTAPKTVSAAASSVSVPLTFETSAPKGVQGGTFQKTLVVSVEPV